MTSVAEMAKYLEKRGYAYLAGSQGSDALRVPVAVVDARNNFGNLELEIVPLEDGDPNPKLGRTWIRKEKVELDG